MKKLILTVAAAAMFVSCANDRDIIMVAGTYTDSGSRGMYSFSFNEKTGEAALLDSCLAVNPSYLTFSKDGKYIYAVSELSSGNAAVYAFGFDRKTGAFTELNTVLTEGADPCYVSTNGKIVVTANYGGSMSVFPIARDGSLRPLKAKFNGSTGGPDLSRQEVPHVHCTEFSPDGKHLYATDFSADRILCFDVVKGGRELRPAVAEDGQQLIAQTTPGDGPRHIAFDRKGRHAYAIGELSGMVTVFDAPDGALIRVQTVDADPSDGRGSADIHLSPDGKFLYASNRLKGDGIAIFKVDSQSGELTEAGYAETGLHPRNFSITPNGKYLLCACRDSDRIEIYLRDTKTGQLTPALRPIPLSKPVCVKFLK